MLTPGLGLRVTTKLDQEPCTNAEARRNSQFSLDAHLVRFAATIATDLDQIAVAPGYLVREWEEDGRRWFRYEMDQPIAHFVSFVSADYTVARD